MTAGNQALVLGIAGLVSTLISTALGLYFTARARTAPMRAHLYERQLDLVHRVFKALGRARLFSTLLSSQQHAAEVRPDAGSTLKRLSILTDEAAALLPTELYAAIRRAADAYGEVVGAFDDGREMDQLARQVTLLSGKAALLARVALGIDELSDETIRLFTGQGALERISEVDLEPYLRTPPGA